MSQLTIIVLLIQTEREATPLTSAVAVSVVQQSHNTIVILVCTGVVALTISVTILITVLCRWLVHVQRFPPNIRKQVFIVNNIKSHLFYYLLTLFLFSAIQYLRSQMSKFSTLIDSRLSVSFFIHFFLNQFV